MPLTLQEARVIIDAGVAKARELDQRPALAVVDTAGHVISLDRMDGAFLHRDQFAIGKAFAAVLLRAPTAETLKMRETRPHGYDSALNMFPGRIYLVPGGVPITVGGEIVGAVGVAGCTGGGNDEVVAEAGIAAWERQRSR
jgi:uncharacterized protein GlcG (DUF336 family)